MTAHDTDLRFSHVLAAVAVGFAFLLRGMVSRRPRAAAPMRSFAKSYAR